MVKVLPGGVCAATWVYLDAGELEWLVDATADLVLRESGPDLHVACGLDRLHAKFTAAAVDAWRRELREAANDSEGS